METNLALRVLTTQELGKDPCLLPLIQMINETYSTNLEDPDHINDRYAEADELLQELGPDGICALILDCTNGKNNSPVAVAGVHRWKGNRNNGNLKFEDDGRDWEIAPAASLRDPKYRKKGLVDRCLQALYTRLLAQVEAGPVRLHMVVLEDLNAEYWKRKGYKQDGERWLIPKGRWHKLHEYVVIDMLKEISPGSLVRSEI